MAWIVGIDEAGYGPNLGPFVMTSVACRLPEEKTSRDLWRLLRKVVRRHGSEDDGRLFVDDSKLVYSTARGLHDLEKSVLAILPALSVDHPWPVPAYLDWLCPTHREELGGECWYAGRSLLPLTAQAAEILEMAKRFDECCESKGITLGTVRSVLVCPPRFNAIVDRWGSKGAVLGQALAELLNCNREPDGGDEPIFFFIDKHGGRNNYAAMLQHALGDGMVTAKEEGMDRSVYHVAGLKRDLQFVIQPRADAEHFCVALASMVSKYLREVLMTEFNAYWQERVPELEATAGYPGDALRFYEAIRPKVLEMGIPESAMWRRK